LLNFYQTGVASILQEHTFPSNISFAGASAGAGLSVLLAQGNDAEEIALVAIDILKPFAGKNILFNPSILQKFADQFLQYFITPSTLQKVDGRVYISITSLTPFKNLVVNRFYDKRDLSKAIRSSCHIPSMTNRSVRFRGMKCIDGGFTNNGPIIDACTIRISPFFFERSADIFPNQTIAPWKAIIVPTEAEAKKLFSSGKIDAQKYIERVLKDGKIKQKCPSKITPFPFEHLRKPNNQYSVY
jgi:patatin-like phospholipase domain-containing protein 2